MSQLIISADSTFDMLPQMIRDLDIRVVPSYVTMGEKSYPDYPDLTRFDLFDYYDRTHTLPQTAAANPDEYYEWFRQFTEQGLEVLHIAKSSGVSSCCQNAALAASRLEGVTVVDSESLGGGSAMVAEQAALHREMGREALAEHLAAFRRRIDGNFVIETLEYLQKGGRCSTLAMMGANLLKLRPEVIFKDGIMTVGKKYRGTYERVLFNYLDDKLAKADEYEHDWIYINHTIMDPDLLKRLVDYVESRHIFRRVLEYPASAAISCHCGPNTFGSFCLRKE